VSIHATAIIERGAQLGRDVQVGPYCVIGPYVVLGDGCRLHHHVTVEGHTTLGEGCEVYPQAVLGMPPQDLKFSGERTTLEIGKCNVFREMVTAHPGTGNGGGVTRIGDRNLFLIGSHIAHDCRIGNRCIFANYVQLAGHVHVEDYVNMGGHSAVHHFVTIGKHAFIGGMTRVAADVPPFVILVAARGTRSEVRMINGVGLQRNGYSNEDIAALKDAFMKLFSRRARMSGVAMRDRVQAILDARPINPNVEYLCECLMRSFAHGRNGRYLESLRADPVHRNSWKLQNQYSLTVNVVGRGSVQRAANRAGDHAPEVFELTAMADPGWAFAGWNGGLSGRTNPASVVLDRNTTVDATFSRQS
jgi:UDP-N-acetylglucosamine acyltransferase